MSEIIPTQIEKCRGAILATAIGDALGWPNEPRSRNRSKKLKNFDNFIEWKRSSFVPRWHDEVILPGEYSDDTQLMLSIARSIIAGDWENFFAEKELPFWLNYERGGGGALLKATRAYKEGVFPWEHKYARTYFNAGGNGATMRILPHVIATANAADISSLMIDVIRDTRITHGHPRAFLGTTCYAYALNYLLKKETILEYGELVEAVIDGQNVWADDLNIEFFREWIDLSNQYTEYDFIEEWNKTRSRMIRQLEFIKMSLNKGLILDDIKILEELECFGSAGGAGDVAILASIYLASRYANNPSTGIKISAFTVGMDTDTIASITGGLLGMLNGMNWIPMQWRNVQDYECLIRMAEVLLKEDKRKAAEEANEIKAQDGQWVATPIGKMKFVEFKNVPNGQHGTVRIEKWYTMLGQTLYTKKFHPKDMQLQSETHEKVYQQNQNKQFMLTLADVDDLLNNPDFKKNITIGKVLKIIKSLINDKHTVAAIAKQLNVEQSVVEQINDYVIFKGDKN